MEVRQLKGLAEAYNQVYYNDDSFVSDLTEICLDNFFETYEDSDYFVHQLVEQDLLEEFLIDLAEELDADISCYLGESFLQEKAAVLRSIINALSAGGRAKAGLRAATALGKTGNVVKGTAASTSIRSARQAASAAQPATPLPNRYLTALQTKRAARGLPPAGGTTAGTPGAVAQRATSAGWQRDAAAKELAGQAVNQAKTVAAAFMRTLRRSGARDRLSSAVRGTSGTGVRIGQPGATRAALPSAGQSSTLSPAGQEIKRLNQLTGGGPLGTTRIPTMKDLGAAPKPAWTGPKELKPPTSAPTVTTPKPTAPKPPSSGYTPPDAGLPFRATGSGGDARTQRLASQAASRSGGPAKRTGVPRSVALGVGAVGAAGITAATVASSQAEKEKQKKDAETRANIKTDVYNTMDPNGRIRSRKKVGQAKIGDTFEDAFRFYRQRGDKTFDYAGKKYTTQLASEDNEQLEVLADKLVIEGYVKDYDGAVSMINSLDENGLSTLAQRIFEA